MRALALFVVIFALVNLLNIQHSVAGPAPKDFDWLEDSASKRTVDWIEAQNKRAVDTIESTPLFKALKSDTLSVLESPDRIVMPDMIGDLVLNFWKDKTHTRGILRVTNKKDFFSGKPKWDILLDIDSLAALEKKALVYRGLMCLRPQYISCLVALSEGGSDAVEMREFNRLQKQFVKDGFKVPAGRNTVDWLDSDTILLSDAWKKEYQTQSGYSKVVRMIRRKEGLESGKIIFSGSETDTKIRSFVLYDGTAQTVFFEKIKTIFHSDYFLSTANGPVKIYLPEGTRVIGIHHHQLIVQIESAFKNYASGALLSIPLSELKNENLNFNVVYNPTPSQIVNSFALTKNSIYIVLQEDIKSRLYQTSLQSSGWVGKYRTSLGSGVIQFISSEDDSDDVIVSYEDFITPTKLVLYSKDSVSRTITQLPSFFDGTRFLVEQNFVLSKDGVRVPYFVVRDKNSKLDGTNPTMLTGYGGFSISMLPPYSPVTALLWLNRGGVLVWSNIRGGGEYGPAWHNAAIKENRQVAYDDFDAVARDIIKRKITSPQYLGIKGTSNGGLMVGVAFTQHPELYRAVVSVVPLMDMLKYSHLSAGASWIGEYGDPDKADEAAYLKKYSPFHNLKENTKYPDMFLLTSSQDDRVHPSHARKMAAYLESLHQPVLFYEDNISGHGMGNNADSLSSELARQFTFLWLKLRS